VPVSRQIAGFQKVFHHRDHDPFFEQKPEKIVEVEHGSAYRKPFLARNRRKISQNLHKKTEQPRELTSLGCSVLPNLLEPAPPGVETSIFFTNSKVYQNR